MRCFAKFECRKSAQIADSAIEQRVRFFQTALTDPAPTIVNPFDPYSCSLSPSASCGEPNCAVLGRMSACESSFDEGS